MSAMWPLLVQQLVNWHLARLVLTPTYVAVVSQIVNTISLWYVLTMH